MTPYVTNGNRVRIFFHGLMVSKFEKGVFKVGIIRKAPDHVFTFFVENHHLTDEIKREDETLTVKLVDTNGATTLPIRPNFPIDPRFDRKAPNKDETDFNFVAEFDGDDLHRVAVNPHPKPFQPKFHFFSGTMSAYGLSRPLSKLKGSQIDDYGRLAEILQIDIPLTEGQELLLQNHAGDKVWKHSYSTGAEVKAYVLNMAFYHYRDTPASSLESCEEVYLPPTIQGRYPHGHFQSYYLSLPLPPDNRFDIFNPNTPPDPESKGNPVIVTDWPTACGMVRVSKGNIGF